MRPRDLAGLILASALVTLDGTAAAIALPAIGRDLSLSVSYLQWVGNAPLLVLVALLLPAGTVVDRYGCMRVIRFGVAGFAAASAACVVASSSSGLIGARLVQGASGAMVLPAVLALLREAYTDPRERTSKFGILAAGTGVASAAGPLLGGGLVDLISWRAVFALSSGAAVAALLFLSGRYPARSAPRSGSVPVVPAAALVVLPGGVAYLLIEGARAGWGTSRSALACVLVVAAAMVLLRSRKRHALLPRELARAHNCLPANGATFALYFGMFGLSFLLPMYTQQVLGYSGFAAAVALLPISVMLFFAEPFGRIAARLGSRPLMVSGALAAALGIWWLATAPHPLPLWSRMIVGTGLFGFGISLAVSPLTHAAVSAVPERCSGAASALNHATVRAAGLIAIALLGSLAAPGEAQSISIDGFRRAMIICGMVVALGGVASSVLVKNEEPGGLGTSAS